VYCSVMDTSYTTVVRRIRQPSSAPIADLCRTHAQDGGCGRIGGEDATVGSREENPVDAVLEDRAQTLEADRLCAARITCNDGLRQLIHPRAASSHRLTGPLSDSDSSRLAPQLDIGP